VRGSNQTANAQGDAAWRGKVKETWRRKRGEKDGEKRGYFHKTRQSVQLGFGYIIRREREVQNGEIKTITEETWFV
jgi:ribosomal protein L32E